MSFEPQIVGGIERTTPPPVENPHPPHLGLPDLACDSHFHIFGPNDRFPFAPERTFTPFDVPKERVVALHDRLGFQRGVIVQSACHGFDHAVVIDALRAFPGRYKAVALLHPAITSDEIAALHAEGFCGARFHFLPHIGADPDFADINALVALTQPFGWHTEIHVNGAALRKYREAIEALPGNVVIDHLGRLDLSQGPDREGVTILRRLMDRGNIWIKLSGADRMTQMPWPFDDAVAVAAALARHNPDRILWGTDFPHPNVHGPMPDDGDLVDLLPLIAQDSGVRRKMLVDNPADFFGFPNP